jgi:hypothetical protein
MKSSGVRVVSRIIRREKASRRMRRGREAGKGMAGSGVFDLQG